MWFHSIYYSLNSGCQQSILLCSTGTSHLRELQRYSWNRRPTWTTLINISVHLEESTSYLLVRFHINAKQTNFRWGFYCQYISITSESLQKPADASIYTPATWNSGLVILSHLTAVKRLHSFQKCTLLLRVAMSWCVTSSECCAQLVAKVTENEDFLHWWPHAVGGNHLLYAAR